MKAMSATASLFRKISIKTADKLGCQYPVASDKYATEWFTYYNKKV